MSIPRSWLYVPGHRPERVRKALASAADAVVVDLEDAVPVAAKDQARRSTVALLQDLPPDSPPVWQNRLPEGVFCIAVAYTKNLARGEWYEVAGAQLGTATLGNTLPAGRYLVRVAITRRSPEQLIVLDAGTFALGL